MSRYGSRTNRSPVETLYTRNSREVGISDRTVQVGEISSNCSEMVLHPGTKVSYGRVDAGDHETVSFSWIIPKFLEAINQNVREFRTVKMEDQRPQLKMQVWGHNRDIIELSCLFPKSVFMNGSVVLDAKRIDNNIGTFDFSLVPDNKWRHLVTLYKNDIKNTVNDYLGSGGDLRLKINFKVIKNATVESTNGNKLSDNLQDTLKNGLYTDVVIKSSGGKEYNVHKVILGSRSAVLKANFEHGTTECHTNVIESPFESEVLEEVLSYIYSDRVSKLKEFPRKLLAAADYYELNGLKNMCEEVLSQELGVENVMELLELANSHQALLLKQAATDCVKKLKYLFEHVDCGDWDVHYCTYEDDSD